MEFNKLLEKTRATFIGADISGVSGKLAYQFDLTGNGSGTFYAEVKDGVLSIEPYEYIDRDVKFTLSATDFEKLLKGTLDAERAYATGKLKIEGDIGKALELKKLLGNGAD